MNPKTADPFLDRRELLSIHHNHLPHWQQPRSLQFVTWSLGDAVPVSVRREWTLERSEWLKQHPMPWTPALEREYHELFSGRIQRWLDAGTGSCLLRDPLCSAEVAGVLAFSEGDRLSLDAFVVMPNHVHVLFLLHSGERLETVLQEWKSISAHRLNKRLGRSGRLWMPDYWDVMIRSPEHYWKVRNYILRNPVKAGLSLPLYHLWSRPTPLWEELKRSGGD